MKRYNKVLSSIRKALQQPSLYTDRELNYMREQLKMLEGEKDEKRKENSRGFGS